MTNRRQAQYQVVVRNRPTDLARATRRLVSEGIEFSQLTIATVEDKALIRFSTLA